MDNNSCKEVIFTSGENFSSFSELKDDRCFTEDEFRATVYQAPSILRQLLNASRRSSLMESLSILKLNTVEPVYYGHLGTNQRCLDYQGVLIFQVSLYDKAPFGTIAT